LIGVEVDLKARKVAKDKNSEQVGEGRAFDAWRDLCASWGSPPLQPHVKSRSGGWHFYYKPPPGVDVKRLRQRGLVKLPGFDQHVIETRVNGFLLIPPSEFGGQAYTYWSSFHDAPYEASPQLIGALEDVRAQPGNTPPASIVKPGSYDLRDFAKYVCKVHHQAGMPREVWRATIFAMVAQYGRYVAYQIAQAIHDGEPQTSYQIKNLVSYASEEFNPGDSTFKTLFKHAHENGIPDSMRPSAAAMFGSPAPILDIDAILAEIDAEVPSPPPPPTGGTPLIGGPRPTPRAPEYGETQIAERFATDYANALRYITSSGSWFHWTGKRWKRDDTDYAVHLVSKHCVAEATLCAGTPGYTAANARTLCSNGTVNAVAQIARKDPRIATTADQWDSDPMLLGTPEGIVDLRVRFKT
jgi:hypothetical protein